MGKHFTKLAMRNPRHKDPRTTASIGTQTASDAVSVHHIPPPEPAFMIPPTALPPFHLQVNEALPRSPFFSPDLSFFQAAPSHLPSGAQEPACAPTYEEDDSEQEELIPLSPEAGQGEHVETQEPVYGHAYEQQETVQEQPAKRWPLPPYEQIMQQGKLYRLPHTLNEAITLTCMKLSTSRGTYFACPECDQHYATSKSSHMKDHLIGRHLKVRSFFCPKETCEWHTEGFCRNDELTRHLDTVHKHRQPHSCATCSKTFGRSDHLTTHRKIYKGKCLLIETERITQAKRKAEKTQTLEELRMANSSDYADEEEEEGARKRKLQRKIAPARPLLEPELPVSEQEEPSIYEENNEEHIRHSQAYEEDNDEAKEDRNEEVVQDFLFTAAPDEYNGTSLVPTTPPPATHQLSTGDLPSPIQLSPTTLALFPQLGAFQ